MIRGIGMISDVRNRDAVHGNHILHLLRLLLAGGATLMVNNLFSPWLM